MKIEVRPPAKALTSLSLLLALVLVLAPPGGSVCWPLLSGRHVHIGWSEPDGHGAPGLTVFAHHDSQPAGNPHHPSFAPASPGEFIPPADTLPAAPHLVWLLPLATLSWLRLARLITCAQPGPGPLEPPPRLSAS